MNKNDIESGFISHLVELRRRLINSFIFLFVFFIICYFFSDYIYGFLVDPYAQAVKDDGSERRLIFTALQETFLTYLKVSFFAAFFKASFVIPLAASISYNAIIKCKIKSGSIKVWFHYFFCSVMFKYFEMILSIISSVPPPMDCSLPSL